MEHENANKNSRAWQKLQNLLAQRAHSETELIQKLKSFDPEEVKKAIKRAKQNKWLEKPKDLSLKIAEELDRKKKGWLYIKYALKKRGLPPLSKNPGTEQQKALYWILKKAQGKHISKKTSANLYRFLANRGFESTDIKEALQQYTSQPEVPAIEKSQ